MQRHIWQSDYFQSPKQYNMTAAATTTTAIQTMIIHRFARSLDTRWLQTLQLVSFHDTSAPQYRQRNNFKFTHVSTSVSFHSMDESSRHCRSITRYTLPQKRILKPCSTNLDVLTTNLDVSMTNMVFFADFLWYHK